MKLQVSDVRTRFAEVLRTVEVDNAHVVLTRNGRVVAGVVPAHEVKMLEILSEAEWTALRARAEAT